MLSGEAAEISVHPVADNYLEYLLAEKGLSENTLQAYAADLSDFLSFLADRHFPLEDVSEQTLFLYIAVVRQQGISGRSLARRLSTLRGLFAFACDQKIFTEDPSRFLENPKFIRSLPEVLTRDEMTAVLAAPDLSEKLGFRDRTMLELLYASGLRASELVAIKPLDFDPATNRIRVFGKGAKERIVPVHAEAAAFVSDYIVYWRALFSPRCNLLFLNRSGKGLSRVALWKIVRRHVLQAGITRPISPHTFRHSFATHLLDGGADLRVVQTLLGHADISATEIYTHVQAGRLMEMHRAHHPRSEK